MPIYSYRCAKCGVEDDFLHPMTAAPATHRHAGCGGVMRRVVSRCGVRLVTNLNGGSSWGGGGYRDKPQDWIMGEDGKRHYFPRENKKTEKAII